MPSFWQLGSRCSANDFAWSEDGGDDAEALLGVFEFNMLGGVGEEVVVEDDGGGGRGRGADGGGGLGCMLPKLFEIILHAGYGISISVRVLALT